MAAMHGPRVFYGYQNQMLVLALKGHIRYMAARSLRPALDDIVARRHHDTMIIDLRELEAIDSTGMGLLARLGRQTLQQGRRAVLVCSVEDVTLCLRSAAFDTLFIVVEHWPFDEEPDMTEMPIETPSLEPDIVGHFMLEAHLDLAALSESNQQEFGGVIAALTTDLERRNRSARGN